MSKPRFKRYTGEKGQSIVEFALFLPVILLVVFVAIQITIIAYYRLLLNQALTDIARTIAVTENPDNTVCQNRIDSILDFYSENALVAMPLDNNALFTWGWEREATAGLHGVVIIRGVYQGMRLPFISDYVISDSICYPSVYPTASGP
ncbi:pilus assembly protein [bacterium]|nr:pilus assembly protein [bacterium]